MIEERLDGFGVSLTALHQEVKSFLQAITGSDEIDSELIEKLTEAEKELVETTDLYEVDKAGLLAGVAEFSTLYCDALLSTNGEQHTASRAFELTAARVKGVIRQIDLLYKLLMRTVDYAEKELAAKGQDTWDNRAVGRMKKEVDARRKDAVEQLKLARYFHKQVEWLQGHFPEAKLVDVEGLVKLVDRAEVEANDWSLTPGRYVGVAPPEVDEDFDFEETLRDIHIELAGLNEEAAELAKTIQTNFEELGV